jgi:UDP-N-acetylmuramoyl-L-alanyl-D-glutamate--2,6-diaminopimelate ligase
LQHSKVRVTMRTTDDYTSETQSFPKKYPVTCHTDHVRPGSTFVAIKGFQKDGLSYIQRALEHGASTIVVDQDADIANELMMRIEQAGACLVRVPNTRKALAQMSARANGYPAKKLRILAVTGTKGKTTCSYLLAHSLRAMGYRVALLSTVTNQINDEVLPTELTTQQPDYLHTFFKVCVDRNIQFVVMEVAAQAQTLYRTHDLEFDGILFTNFSQEHAEFYENQEEYFKAKLSIFAQAKPNAPCLVNADDTRFNAIHNEFSGIKSYSCNNKESTYRALVSNDAISEVATTYIKENVQVPVSCAALIGRFNVYNVLGVMGLLVSLGYSEELVAKAISSFTGVPGRLERYHLPNGAQCFIDYAHNPSSFEAVLSTLAGLTDDLIVVFGAGGDRDRVKRPVMGAIASRYAQRIILTSDNPRSEDPVMIINDIMHGVDGINDKVVQELDRALAIQRAYESSRPGSIIAVLGKGPDEYQLVKGVKTYFSDVKSVLSLT